MRRAPCPACARLGEGRARPVTAVGSGSGRAMGLNLTRSDVHVRGTSLKFSSFLESQNRGTNVFLGMCTKPTQYQEGAGRKRPWYGVPPGKRAQQL